MDKRTLEAVRYLGYGKHAVDDQTLALIRDSFERPGNGSLRGESSIASLS